MPLLPDTAALFLDLDGTLIDIAPTPDAVQVGPQLLETLAQLSAQRAGALACISGRAFADLARLLGAAGIALVGSHGAERLRAAPPSAPMARRAQRCRQALAAWPGVLVEEKPCGLALHWRQAPAAESAVRALAAQLLPELADHRLCEGKQVLELVPAAAGKGAALLALMQQPPFRGRRPVYVGDDFTDIAALHAARALGGQAYAVGPRVAAHADAVFDTPAQVRDWLRRQTRQKAHAGP
ncbi:trehalose-phosphatase [Comamonas antarctica]|uniref:Trehalose 6-phosphate phosphatase n=3 Tax=Comamonas antarctica TaxID=2743470 RepID=A0A6N1XBS4_9BURK|nr:trehalose-phosphatase [Comamonas antarctica]QKV55226.1 trehalose-phosphatase [Comamonas antarctica]